MYIFNMLIQVCLTFKYATTAWLRTLDVRFHLTNMQMPFQILQIVCCQFVTFPSFVCLALHVGILVRFKIAFVVVTMTTHWTYIHVFSLVTQDIHIWLVSSHKRFIAVFVSAGIMHTFVYTLHMSSQTLWMTVNFITLLTYKFSDCVCCIYVLHQVLF